MEYNYIEEELKKPSIFLNENKLLPDYIPKNLLHREKQFKILSNIFKTIIEDPGGASKKLIIYGDIGTGKSAVVKRFMTMLLSAAAKRGINLKYSHINCRINKTAFLILRRIVRSFDNSIPKRGLSSEELVQILNEILEREDWFLIIVLDEIDQLKNSQLEILYSLSRIMDDKLNPLHRLSLILIGKSVKFLKNLDSSTLSTLQDHNIFFERYNKDQLKDIINSRINEVFCKGVVPKETINKICEIAMESGDIRYALELLWSAGKEADSSKLFKILPKFIEDYHTNSKLILIKNSIDNLNEHQILFLKSIIEELLLENTFETSIVQILKRYEQVCSLTNKKPLKAIKVQKIIKILQNNGLITIKRLGNRNKSDVYNVLINTRIDLRRYNELLKDKIKVGKLY